MNGVRSALRSWGSVRVGEAETSQEIWQCWARFSVTGGVAGTANALPFSLISPPTEFTFAHLPEPMQIECHFSPTREGSRRKSRQITEQCYIPEGKNLG
jgi:hypothetical protein